MEADRHIAERKSLAIKKLKALQKIEADIASTTLEDTNKVFTRK
jgi:hypothetical protein